MNAKHTTADLLGLDVTYAGQNGVKQHLFCSGSAIVTHVFATLEEAVERFGKRIKVEPKHYVQSVNFKAGYASTIYAPRPNMDRIERIEYGMGYLKRLIENLQAVPPPKPVDMRLPHEVAQDRAKAAVTPKPAPVVSKAELDASRAALMAAPVAVVEDGLELDADVPVAATPVQAPKRRGRPPKTQ